MNITLHWFGRSLAHIILRRGNHQFAWLNYYVTLTLAGRRWHWDNHPSYSHPTLED